MTWSNDWHANCTTPTLRAYKKPHFLTDAPNQLSPVCERPESPVSYVLNVTQLSSATFSVKGVSKKTKSFRAANLRQILTKTAHSIFL